MSNAINLPQAENFYQATQPTHVSARVARSYPKVRQAFFEPPLMLGNAAHALIERCIESAQRPRPAPSSRTGAFTQAVRSSSAKFAAAGHHAFALVDAVGVGNGKPGQRQARLRANETRNTQRVDTAGPDKQSRAGALSPMLDAASNTLLKLARPPLAGVGGILGELGGSVAGAVLGPLALGYGPSSDEYRRGGAALGRDTGIGISRLLTVLPFCIVKQAARLVTGVARGVWVGIFGSAGALAGLPAGVYAACNVKAPRQEEERADVRYLPVDIGRRRRARRMRTSQAYGSV